MNQSDQNESVLDLKISELKTENPSIFMGIPSMGVSHETDSTHPYHYFKDSLGTEQLVELSYHQYPMVRVFSFLALEEKRFDNMQDVIFTHLTDTTKIHVSNGCVIYTTTIADFIIYEAFYHLKGNAKDSLRDLIFYNHSNLGAFSDILWDCEGYEPYYQKILTINQDSATKGSLMALASYRKEKDLDFLETEINKLEYDYEKFQIIEKHPHDRFKPLMYDYHIKYQKDTTNDPDELFYDVLASYKNKWASGIFLELINSTSNNYYRNRDRLQAIMKATDKHDTTIFNVIREKAYIKLGEDTLNIDFFDYGMFNSWW